MKQFILAFASLLITLNVYSLDNIPKENIFITSDSSTGHIYKIVKVKKDNKIYISRSNRDGIFRNYIEMDGLNETNAIQKFNKIYDFKTEIITSN